MRVVAIGKTVSALESVREARALTSLHFPKWSNTMGRMKKKSPCQLSPFSELDNHLGVLESQGAHRTTCGKRSNACPSCRRHWIAPLTGNAGGSICTRSSNAMAWVWRMGRRQFECTRIVRFESAACDSKSHRLIISASYACTHRIPARTCMQRLGTGTGWPTRFAVTISPWDSTPIPVAHGIVSACIPSIVQRARAAADISPTVGTLRRNAGGVLPVDKPASNGDIRCRPCVRSVLTDQAFLR